MLIDDISHAIIVFHNTALEECKETGAECILTLYLLAILVFVILPIISLLLFNSIRKERFLWMLFYFSILIFIKLSIQ